MLKDNIMTDIKEGFIQRRLPDGGFKVLLTQYIKKIPTKIGKDDNHPI